MQRGGSKERVDTQFSKSRACASFFYFSFFGGGLTNSATQCSKQSSLNLLEYESRIYMYATWWTCEFE